MDKSIVASKVLTWVKFIEIHFQEIMECPLKRHASDRRSTYLLF
jgi:hypothetical protein